VKYFLCVFALFSVLVVASAQAQTQSSSQAPAPVLALDPASVPKIGLSIDAAGKADTEVANFWSTNEGIHFGIDSTYFELHSGLLMNTDGNFSPDIADFKNSQSLGKVYFLIDEGWVGLKALGAEFSIGRIKPQDAVDSPYSLFLNPDARASNSMIFKWDSDIFSYESRWIELNYNSDFGSVAATPQAWQQVWNGTSYQPTGTGFPDRGVNLKNYIFKLGTMRIGFQESATYSQRNFDPEYFASPIPMYFTQYIRDTSGRPWTTSGNDNYMFGLFWDWKEHDFSLYSQVLIDDFNLHFIDPNLFPNNPWKAAWSLGGTVQTDLGRFGFYHAGALKYTFEPITTQPGQDAQSAYGYSYFPDVSYDINGVATPLKIQDYEVGYKNGENNIAFQFSWDKVFFGKLALTSSLEFVLSGNNSPANPWQDATGNNDVGTQLLNQGLLEKRLLLNVSASYPIDNIDLFAQLTFGGLFNQLGLTDPSGRPASFATSNYSALDYYVQIFKPSSADHLVFTLNIGVRLNLDITKGLVEANALPKLPQSAQAAVAAGTATPAAATSTVEPQAAETKVAK